MRGKITDKDNIEQGNEKKLAIFLQVWKTLHTFATLLRNKDTSRSGAEVARWAHNPKVVSSNLASATKETIF